MQLLLLNGSEHLLCLRILLSQSDRTSLLFETRNQERHGNGVAGLGGSACPLDCPVIVSLTQDQDTTRRSLVTILEMELNLSEVLAHERSLMLAILAHLPFTSLVADHISNTSSTPFMLCILCLLYQVALESTSSQIYQLYCSYGGFPFHVLIKC